MPDASYRLYQKGEATRLCQSETIDASTTCKWTFSAMYNLASLAIYVVVHIGRKSTDFVNLSIITQIALLPFNICGNPDMKSIMISAHFQIGISNDLSLLGGFWCSAFTY